jgi:hypothetical protein
MSERFDCEDVRELAPELALGTAVGQERARALEHLSDCAECRKLVADLAVLTDEIVALAPALEPPAGFEGRVLARFEERAQGPVRWRWAALAAAVAGIATALVMLVAFDDDRDLASSYRAALDVADGRYFGVRPLMSDDGMQEGYLFVYEGKPSWVFVALDDSDPSVYSVAAEMDDGKTMELGSFELDDDRRSWGTTVPVEIGHMVEFRLIDESGGTDSLTAEVAH